MASGPSAGGFSGLSGELSQSPGGQTSQAAARTGREFQTVSDRPGRAQPVKTKATPKICSSQLDSGVKLGLVTMAERRRALAYS